MNHRHIAIFLSVLLLVYHQITTWLPLYPNEFHLPFLKQSVRSFSMKTNRLATLLGLTLMLVFFPAVTHALEMEVRDMGAPRIVVRIFTATLEECISGIRPNRTTPPDMGNIWTCRITRSGLRNAFTFNAGQVYKTSFTNTRYNIEAESLVDGIGVTLTVNRDERGNVTLMPRAEALTAFRNFWSLRTLNTQRFGAMVLEL